MASGKAAIAGAVGLVAVTVAALFGTPILGGDDYWIRAIADGSYTGEPSERLIFMSSVLGWLLRGAYTVLPDVAWYALLLYALIAASIAVIARLSTTRPVVVRVALVFIGLYFAARPLVVLSWTETGLIVVGAGIILALCGPTARTSAIAAGLIIGIGFMVRPESIGAVLGVVPLLWVVRDRWQHLLVVGLVAGGLIGPAYAYDRLHYTSDPQWAEWSEFEEIRRNLHGTPKVALDSDMSDVLAAAGWSENDLFVFLRWHYADEDVFTVEALRTIHDARRFAHAGDPRQVLTDTARRHAGGFALVALALGLVGARRWWVAVGSATWLTVLFTAMEVTFRSRSRIEAVIVLAVAVALVFLLHDRDRSVQPFLVLAAVALTLPGIIDLRAATTAARAERAEIMSTLEQLDPHATYINVAGALPMGDVNPFDGGMPPASIVLTGWTVRSPHFAAHMERAGIDDLYLDPVRRRDVLIVGLDAHVASVIEFMREHYGMDPLVEKVGSVRDRVNVWRVT